MSVNDIIYGKLDLYEFLQVEPQANITTIRRQYRRIALKYHPDKNIDPEAVKTFQLVSQIYEILSHEESRKAYDELRRAKRLKQQRQDHLDEKTKAFKEQLLQREKNLDSTSLFNKVNSREVQKLQEEGFRRRKLLETKYLRGSMSYVSYRELPITPIFDITDNFKRALKVVLKWKYRPELKDKFTIDIIKDIMSVFGHVESIQQIPDLDNYNAAVLQYSNLEEVDRATTHNYHKTASLWDGTPYRKLASLLRECKVYKPCTFNKQLNKEFTKYHDINASDILTDNESINDVVIDRVNEELSKLYLT